MPLLPAFPEEKAVTQINAGEAFGLGRWVRYERNKFHLFEYLKVFMQRLGFQVETYNSLDGQKLVPYMCVVRRDQWEVARARTWPVRYSTCTRHVLLIRHYIYTTVHYCIRRCYIYNF